MHFSPNPPKVHVMHVWLYAAKQARVRYWQQFAVDRERFQRRWAKNRKDVNLTYANFDFDVCVRQIDIFSVFCYFFYSSVTGKPFSVLEVLVHYIMQTMLEPRFGMNGQAQTVWYHSLRCVSPSYWGYRKPIIQPLPVLPSPFPKGWQRTWDGNGVVVIV